MSLTVLAATAALFAASASDSASITVSGTVAVRCDIRFDPSGEIPEAGDQAPVGWLEGECNIPHRIAVAHDPVDDGAGALAYEGHEAALTGSLTVFDTLEGARRYAAELTLRNDAMSLTEADSVVRSFQITPSL